MPPLISVVSPSWNQGEFLEECIKSCISASPDEVEHIVVDNCSDDSTPEVIARYPHLRSIVEADRGQSNALNKGIEAARADWILWLNVDDFLVEDTIEKYLDLVRQGCKFDAVYGHMNLVDQNSKLIRTVFQGQWRPWMIRFGAFGLPSTGTLFERSKLLEHPLAEDYHMIMDSEWSLRTAGRVRALRLRRETVAFRLTENNKTSSNVSTGAITPRHAEERLRLSSRFPAYGKWGETDQGIFYHSFTYLIRKIARFWILGDKFLSSLKKKVFDKTPA